MNRFKLLREAVQTYKVNHCDGDKNEKELLEFIDELEQLLLHNISNSTCDEIFEQAAKIDVDNDIHYGQHPI